MPPSNNITPLSADDSELLSRYKQTGDLKPLGDLYNRYMDLVFAVCLKYLKDRESAKDAVMDIFEQLILKLQKHEVSNFKSWLYTVAKNHCLMQLRSLNVVRPAVLDEASMQSGEEMHPAGMQENEWRLEQLTRCIEKLSDSHRSSIELFYLKGKCYKEIASITGLEWNKVRSLIQNGRRNLKICMENSRRSNGEGGSINGKLLRVANKDLKNE